MTQRVSPPAALTNLALAGNAEAQFELAELYMKASMMMTSFLLKNGR